MAIVHVQEAKIGKLVNHTEQRNKLRVPLAGSKCVSPASVFDPLSARVAEAVGYEIGMLSGSLASTIVLGAPDLNILTLTEYADQIRRIMRVSNLSLFVDADHGYGNALNVMRTIQELEHAGVAGLSIEDTSLPRAFGQPDGDESMISTQEAAGKMRAAVAARCDPSLVIAARTSALVLEDIESTLARVAAYAAAGVDAIYLATDVVGKNVYSRPDIREQIKAVNTAAQLPLILSAGRSSLKREELAACGVRIMTQGLQPAAAAVKALQQTYTHLLNGGAPAQLKSSIALPEEMEQLVNAENYQRWLRGYMR